MRIRAWRLRRGLWGPLDLPVGMVLHSSVSKRWSEKQPDGSSKGGVFIRSYKQIRRETHHDGFKASTATSLRSVRFASYHQDGMDGDRPFLWAPRRTRKSFKLVGVALVRVSNENSYWTKIPLSLHITSLPYATLSFMDLIPYHGQLRNSLSFLTHP